MLGRNFEVRVKFTRKRHIMWILSLWWLSNCHKLSCKLRKNETIRAKWKSFRPVIQLPFASAFAADKYVTFIPQLLWIKFYFSYHVFLSGNVKFIKIVPFCKITIPRNQVKLRVFLEWSFPIPISRSEKPRITIRNALYLIFRTKNLI